MRTIRGFRFLQLSVFSCVGWFFFVLILVVMLLLLLAAGVDIGCSVTFSVGIGASTGDEN